MKYSSLFYIITEKIATETDEETITDLHNLLDIVPNNEEIIVDADKYHYFEIASYSLVTTKLLLDLGFSPALTYKEHGAIYFGVQGKLRQLYDFNCPLSELRDNYTNYSDANEFDPDFSWYDMHYASDDMAVNKYMEYCHRYDPIETEWPALWPLTSTLVEHLQLNAMILIIETMHEDLVNIIADEVKKERNIELVQEYKTFIKYCGAHLSYNNNNTGESLSAYHFEAAGNNEFLRETLIKLGCNPYETHSVAFLKTIE